ncbi:GntR family transcriptional regulator [beta proteobacterium MWH-UniP1]
MSTEKTLIPRQGLHDAVADRLRQYVVEGKLLPGQRLNERVLCEQMGVSRTPMREAIKKLAGEGLVRLEPNRGAVVHRLTPDEVAAAFEVVASMEALSGELAAQRATPEQIQHVLDLQGQMELAHRNNDLPSYYRINSEIHAAINEAAGNPVLTEMFRSINLRLQSLRFRSNLDQKKWDAAVKEHKDIANALASRDQAGLSLLLRQHLMNKREIVLKLSEQES